MARILVIDTATAACSVALLDGGRVVAALHDEVGRGHAERLIPMIAALPGGGRADRILVDVGPGSFTGIRVGIAAARGLALGWGVGVSGYSSLALVAEQVFSYGHDGPDPIAVVQAGGHGEVFMQMFADEPFAAVTDLVSLTPAAAIAQIGRCDAVGSGVDLLSGLPTGQNLGPMLPDATFVRKLMPAFIDLPPSPLYGRAPDAKLPSGPHKR